MCICNDDLAFAEAALSRLVPPGMTNSVRFGTIQLVPVSFDPLLSALGHLAACMAFLAKSYSLSIPITLSSDEESTR